MEPPSEGPWKLLVPPASSPEHAAVVEEPVNDYLTHIPSLRDAGGKVGDFQAPEQRSCQVAAGKGASGVLRQVPPPDGGSEECLGGWGGGRRLLAPVPALT